MLERIAHGNVLEIRLARPPVNALNPELLAALATAFGPAQLHGVEGVVLSGGPKVFSGGLDVPHLLSLDRAGLTAAWSGFFATARAIAHCPVPVVAAIGGHSPAGGCVLALCCDYRVMARSADPARPCLIGLNEVQVGLVAPEGIQRLMRRVVGPHRAGVLLAGGQLVSAERALEIGLVDELADGAGAVAAQAIAWLQAQLELPRQPMLQTRAIARADLHEAMQPQHIQLERFVEAWYSADAQTALQALAARLGKS